MKVSLPCVVIFLLSCVLFSSVFAAAPAPESSSDPTFDPQQIHKLAVIVAENGAERSSVTVKRGPNQRSIKILTSPQTGIERDIEDEFLSVLMNKGYALCTRSDLLSVLKEGAIQDFGVTEDNAAGIGKLLNVQAVLLVRLTGLPADNSDGKGERAGTRAVTVSIGARLIGVPSAKILWTGRWRQSIATSDPSKRVQAVLLAAKRIASTFPKRSEDAASPGKIPSEPNPNYSTSQSTSLPTITNSIGMKLALIPAGEFLMGSPDSDSEAESGEKPQHNVQITKPFYLGVHEVTQGQYQQVMGSNPSRFKQSGETAPVETVSWEEVQEFCRKLSALPTEKAVRRQYRLPTEAEWEYACRAGSTSRYYFGDSAANLDSHAWHSGNSGATTHPVGQKQPNAWGLYDMHGNVLEWCNDWHGPYQSAAVRDPGGAGQASVRVLRGGGFGNNVSDCRSALRTGAPQGSRNPDDGFRVVVIR